MRATARSILYDNRGVGLWDPVPGGAAPTMDEQVDDIRAILDETGCQRAVLVGNMAGCAPALVFAATHPGRVESLILLSGYARLRAGAGYPQGLDQAYIRSSMNLLATWGSGADLDLVAPAVAADDNFRRWYAQVQRMSASPATAVAMARQWYEVDVRGVLPAIKVPTLVMARAGNVIFPVHHTRYLADHIAGAKYIELPGADLLYFVATPYQVLDAIEEFVTDMLSLPSPARILARCCSLTCELNPLAAEIGDSRFRELIHGFHHLVDKQLDVPGPGGHRRRRRAGLFDSPAGRSLREAVTTVRASACGSAPACIPARWNTVPREVRGIAVQRGGSRAGGRQIWLPHTSQPGRAPRSGWRAAVSTN